MKKTIATTLVVLLNFYCFSQNNFLRDSSTEQESKPSRWNISAGLTFSAVPTYNIIGTDTSLVNTLSLFPSINIRNRSGLGIIYSPRFVTGGSKAGMYMHMLTIGFEQYDKPKTSFVAEYSHLFFTGNKSLPPTPLTNEIYSSFTYKKAFLRPHISADIGFGKQTINNQSSFVYDFGMAAGVGHLFAPTSNFSFEPALFLHAGTNEYFSFLQTSKYISQSEGYQNYVESNSGKGSGGKSRGRGNGSSGSSGSSNTSTTTTTTTIATTSTTSTKTLSLSNAELNLELEYEKNNFSIYPSGSLFVPIGNNSGGGLTGYWEIKLQYSF